MLKENKVLMSESWYSLSGRWKDAVIATLIFVAISAAAGVVPYLGWIAGIVIGGPLMLGYIHFIVGYDQRDPEAKIETVFSGFNNFLNAFIAQLLMTIFILLWMLLLIVPGIMAAYSYQMTFFVMNDNPGISGQDAITRSKEMMRGNRWKLFCLDVRFIGWWLLCLLTLGILTLWITPYWYTARSKFYHDLLGLKEQDSPIPETAPQALADFYRENQARTAAPEAAPQAENPFANMETEEPAAPENAAESGEPADPHAAYKPRDPSDPNA